MRPAPLPGRILVVDDDPDVRSAARLALAPRFEQVQTLGRAGEIPEAVAGLSPDAVLLEAKEAQRPKACGARSTGKGLSL